MRRLGTWAALGGLAVVALLAGVDAFRGGQGGPVSVPNEQRPARGAVAQLERVRVLLPAEAPELSDRSFLAGTLERHGIAGILVVSDERCRLRAYLLPWFAPAVVSDRSVCAFTLSRDGWLSPEGPAWHPEGGVAAVCRGARVFLVQQDGGELQTFPGCSPAWKPDGTLTWVREGELVGPDGTVVVSQSDLRTALADDPVGRALPSFSIERALWTSAQRVALVVRARYGRAGRDARALVVASGGRLRLLDLGDRIARLAASSAGAFLAARVDGRMRLFALDGGRVPFALPEPAEAVRAVAWSPDEHWLAAATEGGLYFLPRAPGRQGGVPVAVDALDVGWR